MSGNYQAGTALQATAWRCRFGGFEVDFKQRELRKRGMRVRLQHKPFQILELLLRRAGELVTRDEMARQLWPNSHVCFERGLNTAVNALRHALGDSSHDARFIETRAGLGYAFIAPVEQITEPCGRGTDDPAYQDCVKGYFFLDRMTEEDSQKAVAYFESALAGGNCAAAAYAGLTQTWCEFGRLSMMPSRTAAEKAKEFAILALSSDSQASAAHLALARVRMLFERDVKGAQAEFSRALELDSRSAAAHRTYGSFLSGADNSERALEHFKTALSIEPLSLATGVELAWSFYACRKFESAAEQCWKVLALEARCWPAQLVLGLSYAQLGMRDEAIAELENAVVCSGRNPIALGALGYIGAGNSVEILTELTELAARRYVSPFSFALVYAGLGSSSTALQWMQRAVSERDVTLLWFNRKAILEPMFSAAAMT